MNPIGRTILKAFCGHLKRKKWYCHLAWICCCGDLPSGAGLSSSASLEVLIGFIMRDLYGFDVTNVDLALIGQQAEHEFCGVNCGIMDQFAVAMGKKGSCTLLNTKTFGL